VHADTGDVIGLHAAQFNPLAWTAVPCGSDTRQRYRHTSPYVLVSQSTTPLHLSIYPPLSLFFLFAQLQLFFILSSRPTSSLIWKSCRTVDQSVRPGHDTGVRAGRWRWRWTGDRPHAGLPISRRRRWAVSVSTLFRHCTLRSVTVLL